MKIKNKLILTALMFSLIGCTNPTSPEPLSTAQIFQRLQDKDKETGKEEDKTPFEKKTVDLPETKETTPLIFDNVKPARILFDTGKNPLGNTDKNNIKQLDSLTNILNKYKFNPVFSPLSEQNSLDKFDVIALISPSIEYNPPELQRITDFVKAGKKVIITGEWGGYSGFSSNSINEFLKQANLRINNDLVKETEQSNYKSNQQQILISSFKQNPVTENIKKLILFSTASIEILNENNNINQAKIVALSSNNSFKIQSINKQAGLIAVSDLGLGMVVVIGDTSLFTNQQVNSNGKINLEEENNQQLALNIFSI